MTTIGYMRVVYPMKCNNCGHKAYDVDFEKYSFVVVDEPNNGYEAEIKRECPICQSKDIEYTEQQNNDTIN